jgi:hypothetical protein
MKKNKHMEDASTATTGAEMPQSATTAQGSFEPQGKSPERLTAEGSVCSFFVNSWTSRAFSLNSYSELDAVELALAVREKVEKVKSGDLSEVEGILIAQAISLDTIFNALARNAAAKLGQSQAMDIYLRNAFKAQAQCRATLQTLAEIKNPRPVSFVRQANIAHGPQQINNQASAATVSRARAPEGNPIQSNELLEADHGQRLDPGTTSTTSCTDPHLEAVGTIHRPAD